MGCSGRWCGRSHAPIARHVAARRRSRDRPLRGSRGPVVLAPCQLRGARGACLPRRSRRTAYYRGERSRRGRAVQRVGASAPSEICSSRPLAERVSNRFVLGHATGASRAQGRIRFFLPSAMEARHVGPAVFRTGLPTRGCQACATGEARCPCGHLLSTAAAYYKLRSRNASQVGVRGGMVSPAPDCQRAVAFSRRVALRRRSLSSCVACMNCASQASSAKFRVTVTVTGLALGVACGRADARGLDTRGAEGLLGGMGLPLRSNPCTASIAVAKPARVAALTLGCVCRSLPISAPWACAWPARSMPRSMRLPCVGSVSALLTAPAHADAISSSLWWACSLPRSMRDHVKVARGERLVVTRA